MNARIHPTGAATNRGFSLVEVMVGSVAMVLLAGGTMMAFVSARRIAQEGSNMTKAASYLQQSLERNRNMIACDTAWFDASCNPNPNPGGLPDSTPDPFASPSDMYGGSRKVTVTPMDCDGVGGTGDCFEVAVTVHWNPPQ